jgi:hypothetical protein
VCREKCQKNKTTPDAVQRLKRHHVRLAFLIIVLVLVIPPIVTVSRASAIDQGFVDIASTTWKYVHSTPHAPRIVIELGSGSMLTGSTGTVAARVQSDGGVGGLVSEGKIDELILETFPSGIYMTFDDPTAESSNVWLNKAIEWAWSQGYGEVHAYGYSAGAVIWVRYGFGNSLGQAWPQSDSPTSIIAKAYISNACQGCFQRASTLRTPILLLQGTQDTTANLNDAIAFYNQIPARKEMLTFPDDHNGMASIPTTQISAWIDPSSIPPVTTTSTSSPTSGQTTSTTVTSSSSTTSSTSTTTISSVSASPVGDFSLLTRQPALSLVQGSHGNLSLVVQSDNQFSNPVRFTAPQAPTGVGVDFRPNPVTPPKGRSVALTATISVGPVTSGIYQLTVLAASGNIQHALTITLQVSGCLIATATFGSELSPEVQFLRDFRDNKILHTFAGAAFMTAFNEWYYTFSPTVANYENTHAETILIMKVFLYPLIAILHIGAMPFDLLSGNSEVAAFMSGIIVGILLGSTYVTIPVFLIFYLSSKVRRIARKIEQSFAITLIVMITLAFLAELTHFNLLMTTSAVTIILATITLAAMFWARRYLRLFSHHNKLVMLQNGDSRTPRQ